MLVEKSKAGNVMSVKLLSGEEVIGKLKSDDAHAYKLESPRVIGTSNGKDVVVAPFMLSIDGEKAEVTLLKKHVTAVAAPAKHIKDEYVKYVKSSTAKAAGLVA